MVASIEKLRSLQYDYMAIATEIGEIADEIEREIAERYTEVSADADSATIDMVNEFIITDKQLKTAIEAYLEHELSRPITEVFISGDKLPEIVRCRDCKHYDKNDAGCNYFVLAKNKLLHIGNPNGFCAWGERLEQ